MSSVYTEVLRVTKGETIVLRISTENKAAIKAAADRAGKSLTTFITESAIRRAHQTERRPPTSGVHNGLPTWFRATCSEAAQGGSGGYGSAGMKLAYSIGTEIPYDIDDKKWAKRVASLRQLLADDDDDAVWAWFEEHYPRCTALIPSRRCEQFIAGVRRAHEEGRIEL
jgi:hypothetical protein